MKTNRKPKKHISTLFILIALVALAIGGYFLWRYKFNQPKPIDGDNVTTQKIDLNPPTTDQKAASEAQKASNNTLVQSTTFTASITAFLNGDTVRVQSIITGAISNSGTCELTLMNNGIIVTKTASTLALPASSTCQGFDINRSELSTGTWAITLVVIIGSETTTVTSEIILV